MTIDITTDFTKDCPYWETYAKGSSKCDPDTYSPKLRLYQQLLYSRKIPGGPTLTLKQGKNKNYDYLVCDTMRFGSDSIINMYAYKLPHIEKDIQNYKEKIESYIHEGYTIGGEIIFPKHRKSVNTERGWNHKIKDRFDLTLECIRRFYNGETSPLYNMLKTDEKFFYMFGTGINGFKKYVDFFFLNDLVSDDYAKIKLFFGEDQPIFEKNPLPQNTTEWEQLFKAQMKFLTNRNKRIKIYCDTNRI